jgi:hypothetical protein
MWLVMDIRWFFGVLLLMSPFNTFSGEGNSRETAREDLAVRLKIPVEQITVISQTEKTWPDASLGCPRKGMKYKQVLTNGSQLILDAAGRRYFYHAKAGKAYSYCAVPAKQNRTPPTNEEI